MKPNLVRRVLLLGGWRTGGAIALMSAALLAGCGTLLQGPPADPRTPIVFVHGNGDSAATWTTLLWRFESNGWPRSHLHAVDFPLPLARDEDDKPQPGRSGTDDQLRYLSDEVKAVLRRTGARQVALVGNSRGGYVIRNYIRNGDGGRTVSHVVLGGVPNHGVWATDFRLNSEFNGAGPFLSALNAPQGPDGNEVTPGPRWLTLRSQGNDKFAQPDGRWIGQPNLKTNVTEAGPALKGAQNLVLGKLDHREVSYHADAFVQTWSFVTGQPLRQGGIIAQASVVLDGRITGYEGTSVTNQPLPGSMLEIYKVNPDTGERLGAAVHSKTVTADGRWGPFTTDSSSALEFIVSASGFATTHIYRSPFARSSDVVNLRPRRLADADRNLASIITLDRPRGYFDAARYQMQLDGKPLAGIGEGVAGTASARVVVAATPSRAVVGLFERERIVVRNWPVSENRVVIAELHY
jgi:triacylglycerol lipase